MNEMNVTWETRFDTIIEQLNSHILSASRIHSLLDLTYLNEAATENDMVALGKQAQQQHVAAICVYPQHLAWIPPLDGIRLATVSNFPSGNLDHEQILQDIEQVITQQHVEEIDYVFAYSVYLSGQKSHALACCRDVYELCQTHGRKLKVILETGALPSLDRIYTISRELVDLGCGMLKTSTGKITPGASLQAVFVMLSAIKDSQSGCGIKISGGIKTLAQASVYIHLSEHMLEKNVGKNWFRIGASQIKQDC